MFITSKNRLQSVCSLQAVLGCIKRNFSGIEGFSVNYPVPLLEAASIYCCEAASCIEEKPNANEFWDCYVSFCSITKELCNLLREMYEKPGLFTAPNKYDKKLLAMLFSYLERICLAFEDEDNQIYISYVKDLSALFFHTVNEVDDEFVIFSGFKRSKLSSNFITSVIENPVFVSFADFFCKAAEKWAEMRLKEIRERKAAI